MRSDVYRKLLVLAVLTGAACSARPEEDVETRRSAVNSNVVVTVRNQAGTVLQGVKVRAQRTNGTWVTGTFTTNAQGNATLSLAAGSYRFRGEDDFQFFWSGAAGHCVTPACTTANITVNRVTVTVVDTGGAPQPGYLVKWLDTAGDDGHDSGETGVNGQAQIAVPSGSYQFHVYINGLDFWSGDEGHCVVPTCTAATITITHPITVTVVDGAGAPIPDLLVKWENTDGDDGAYNSTDASGHAEVSVPPGATRFSVRCPPYTSSAETFYSGPVGHCVVPGCTTAEIVRACNQCAGKPNGFACNDNNACTQTDTCQGGTCTGSNPVTCTASDQCHNAGTCNPGTGVCSNPAKPNGTSCNDANACTQTDTCQAGTCTGSNPVTCTASDQCHDAGTCNPANGTCSNPAKANGSACSDGNACTQTDTCQAGSCTGGNPVTCTASDQCHDAGTCDPGTGACANPPKANGAACNDANACTQTDACQSGACNGGNPVTCLAQDQCHLAGTCDPGTGACSNPVVSEGAPCGSGGQCAAGVCQPATPPGNPPSHIDPTVAMDLRQATAFLYEGPNAVQVGVAPGTIKTSRAAVFRGRVLNRAGAGVANVTVQVKQRPEYGLTRTGADGVFSLAVNGGEHLRLEYSAEGYLPVQRAQYAPLLDYAWFEDVVLTTMDPARTIVNLPTMPSAVVAQATPSSDASGVRQSVLLFFPGTQATIELDDGSQVPLSTLSVHSSEYTVGDSGPEAMPAALPPHSGYTYAAELTVEEANAAGAKQVTFSQPVVNYVDNFLGFPVGTPVPSGYYDRAAGSWVPSPNGTVIKVLDTLAGFAEVDVNGDDVADDPVVLAALGINDEERGVLASLYLPGESLWRVPVTHFSPYDYNWPFSPPTDAVPPPDPKPRPENERREDKEDECKEMVGSTVGCSSQILTEQVGVAGTPFVLNYSSARSPAYGAGAAHATITLSGPTVPQSLQRIDVTTVVAGQTTRRSFPPAAAQTLSVDWDGKDGFGRTVGGRQGLGVFVSYVYPAVYNLPRETLAASFGAFTAQPGVQIGPTMRDEFTFGKTAVAFVERPRAALEDGFGGWTLNVHHAYDPRTQRLMRGDDDTLSSDPVGRRAPENTSIAYPQCPGAHCIRDFKGTPDGSIYVSSMVDINQGRLFRILPDGGEQVVASNVFAKLLAIGNNKLYFTDQGNPFAHAFPFAPTRIRRVNTDGTTTLIAGDASPNCTPAQNGSHSAPLFHGDDGPATDACLEDVRQIEVAPDGTIYVLAYARTEVLSSSSGQPLWYWRIRRIDADGRIRFVLSGGVTGNDTVVDLPSLFADRLAITNDYTLYLTHRRMTAFDPAAGNAQINNAVVSRVLPDGTLAHVAGTDTPVPLQPCPATDHDLASGNIPLTACRLAGAWVDPAGSIYTMLGTTFTDPQFPLIPQLATRPLRIGRDGVMSSAFAGPNLNTNPFLGMTFPGDGSVLLVARAYAGLGQFDHQYWGQSQLYRLRPPLPGPSDNAILVRAGDEIFAFDKSGRHLRTVDTVGAATKYEFHYGSHGLLTGVTDRNGRTTTIERDGNGSPMAIVSPVGHRTSFGLDTSGYLASITSPVGGVHQFTYVNGALTHEIDARGGVHEFGYDANGRLISDRSPTTGEWTFTRSPDATTVTATSPQGTSKVHVMTEPPAGSEKTTTNAAGQTSTSRVDAAGSWRITSSEGVTLETTTAPDPRFGASDPYVAKQKISTAGGLTRVSTASRAATIANGDPLAMVSQTESVVVNGKTTTTVYDGATRTTTTTSPMGRQTVMRQDERGRVLFAQRGNLAPRTFTYDGLGRQTSVAVGTGAETRTTTTTYDFLDRPAMVTDASLTPSQLGFDAGNRLTSLTQGEGPALGFAYSGAGDLMSVTPPGRPAYGFGYTPAGDHASFSVPAVSGENPTIGFEHDLDRRLTRILGPDGTQIVYGYQQTTGRLASVAYPKEIGNPAAGSLVATLTYSPATGKLQDIGTDDGQAIAFQHDGQLLLSAAWSGAVAGSVSHTFDNDFRPASQAINGAGAIAFGYDNDGLLTSMGSLTITRDVPNGLATDTALGSVTDHSTYTSFGEVRDYEARHAGAAIYRADYPTRDALGRIETRSETILGDTTTWAYGYDARGRLSQVMKNGALSATYSYGANGNRTSAPGLTTAPVYDDQDRLLHYGNHSYSYTAAGELRTKTDATSSALTTYRYDGSGALRRVELPDGHVIDYVIDPMGRRVGKRVDGVLVKGWLYSDELSLAAELDGTGAVVSRFVGREYLVRSGTTYRLVRDHLGSVRLVVDVATGAVAQRLDYDEFGKVLLDSSPGFQPLGFAGGLYDAATGLVRFGARDYDPETGRWLARDKLGFSGGQANLYEYVAGDPVNRIDPSGLDWFHFFLVLSGAAAAGFHTDINGAVFYTGNWNQLLANRFKKCRGKKTIEDTPGGKMMETLTKIFGSTGALTPGEIQALWMIASAQYAAQASGHVDVFASIFGGANPIGTFTVIELPILVFVNDNVRLSDIHSHSAFKDPCCGPP